MMRVCQRLRRHLWELGILNRLTVSPAVYPRFLESLIGNLLHTTVGVGGWNSIDGNTAVSDFALRRKSVVYTNQKSSKSWHQPNFWHHQILAVQSQCLKQNFIEIGLKSIECTAVIILSAHHDCGEMCFYSLWKCLFHPCSSGEAWNCLQSLTL